MSSLSHIILPIRGQLFALPGGSSSAMDSNQFLAQAMQDSLAEIESCELALEKSSNDDVKAFSQRMIETHSRLGREIEQLAGKKSATLPNDVSPGQKAAYEDLSKLMGKEFDKEFMERNVQGHEQDIKEYKEQSEHGTDPDIKTFAEKNMHILAAHLKMAKDIGNKLQSR